MSAIRVYIDNVALRISRQDWNLFMEWKQTVSPEPSTEELVYKVLDKYNVLMFELDRIPHTKAKCDAVKEIIDTIPGVNVKELSRISGANYNRVWRCYNKNI